MSELQTRDCRTEGFRQFSPLSPLWSRCRVFRLLWRCWCFTLWFCCRDGLLAAVYHYVSLQIRSVISQLTHSVSNQSVHPKMPFLRTVLLAIYFWWLSQLATLGKFYALTWLFYVYILMCLSQSSGRTFQLSKIEMRTDGWLTLQFSD